MDHFGLFRERSAFGRLCTSVERKIQKMNKLCRVGCESVLRIPYSVSVGSLVGIGGGISAGQKKQPRL